MKSYVSDIVDYFGVDLFQNTQGNVDYVVDVAQGLPMEDYSFDYVVALDVLEHLDDLEFGLNELLRVTKKSLIIMLPNIAHISLRMRFALTGRISGKYDMKYGAGKDRHRWVTTQVQSDPFIREFASIKGMELEIHHFVDSKKKQMFANVCRLFRLSPNIWSWASFYVLKRPDVEAS